MADSINIPSLSGGEVEGAGAFDELMRTVKSNLEQEFTKNRITGSNYSTVYLGALTQVLQTAAQYSLEAPVASKQVLLMAEQITQAEQQTCLLQKQICNTEADTAIKTKQLEIMVQQLLDMQANTCLVNAKTLESTCTLEVMGTQVCLNQAQKCKIEADTNYVGQQCLIGVQQECKIKCDQALVGSQTMLTTQKCITEQAQTSNPSAVTVTNICDSAGADTGYKCFSGGGVLGAQIALINKQKDGFDRDAQQKAAKLLADNWSIRQSTICGQDPFGAGMSDCEINRVLDTVKKGIFLCANSDTNNPSS